MFLGSGSGYLTVRPEAVGSARRPRPALGREPTQPPLSPQDPTFRPCQMKTHFLLPFPVNHVGECVRTAPYTDPDHARYGREGERSSCRASLGPRSVR